MKNSGWVIYLFTDESKSDIFKIMEFKTIKDIGYVFSIDPQEISNFFHGLIRPRGILKNLVLYQSVNLLR
tara:strand:+ start:1775 stop:1984 length:210 start_codon:yes stop_codon:yes gene_type:complete